MKYLLMTSIVAALLVCPGCNRRDPADEPTYSNEDQQAPPSPVGVSDNPTVLADQVLLARLAAAGRVVPVATKPASAPAPAGPGAGSFMGVGGSTVPEAPASQPPTLATEPAKPEAAPATEPAKPEGAGEGAPAEPSSPAAPENPG